MTFRKFDTETWTDPWFESLSPKAKLGFIFFWTNEICTQAGIYNISDKRIKFHLGYSIDTISAELIKKVVWYPDKNIVWVKNFFKRQCQNYKFAISALKSIESDNLKLSIFIKHNKKLLESFKNKEGKQIIDLSLYHIDTISIPDPTEKKQNREEAEADKEKDLSASDDAVHDFYITKKKKKLERKRLETFNIFWEKFDYKRGKAEAADAWLEIPELTNTLCETIYGAAEREAIIRPKLIEDGHTPKMAEGWIRGKRWEDEDATINGTDDERERILQRVFEES